MSRVTSLWTILPAGALVVLLALVLSGPLSIASFADVEAAWNDDAIRSSVMRTIWTSVLSASIGFAIAVPAAFHASFNGRYRVVADAVVDMSLALPPSVVGLCLVLVFRQGLLRPVDDWIGISLGTPAVVVAQTVVATALATRLMIAAFDRFPREAIEVGRVLGGTPRYLFRSVVLPASRTDLIAAGVLAWARAFGEFGPVLLFAGVTRFRTEVLSTSIHLELTDGRLGVAAVLALLMMTVAVAVTLGTRHLVDRRQIAR